MKIHSLHSCWQACCSPFGFRYVNSEWPYMGCMILFFKYLSSHHKILPSDAICIIYTLCLSCSMLDLKTWWSRKQSVSASADEFAQSSMKFKRMSVFLLFWNKVAGIKCIQGRRTYHKKASRYLEGEKLEESSGGRDSFLRHSLCLPFTAAAQVQLMKICHHCAPLF